MQVPKRSDAHIRLSHILSDFIMTHKFSQPERYAIDLILRLSWGCNKEWCHIPHLADFEEVGIYRQDIRTILETLRMNNIIFWNEETNHFAFNKMLEQWRVPMSKLAVKKRKKLPELVHLNLSGTTPEPPKDFLDMLAKHQQPVSDLLTFLWGETPDDVSRKLTSQPQEEKSGVSLKLTNKPDDVSLKLTEVVSTPASAKESILKKEEEVPPTTPDPPTPLSAAEEKPEKTVTDPEPTKVWTPLSKNFGAVCTLYEKNIGILSPILGQELDDLASTYELDWIEAAIKEACAMQKRHLKYIAAILERWGTEGYKAPMGKSFKGIPGRPPTRNLPTADELEKAWKGRKEV